MTEQMFENNDPKAYSSSNTLLSNVPNANLPSRENKQILAEEYYRHYRLMFQASNTFCIGEVFQHDERLAYCEASDLDSARQYCRQIVDTALAQASAKKQPCSPSQDEISQALSAIQLELNHATKQLLLAHIECHNTPIESEQLKIVGGFNSTTEVMLAYAHFARLLCDALCYTPPPQDSGQDAYISMVIETHEPNGLETKGLSVSLTEHIFESLRYQVMIHA